MAPVNEVLARLQRKHRPRSVVPGAPAGFDPYPGFTAQPPPPPPEKFWQDMIQSDPLYLQDLADILAGSNIDRSGVESGLRQSLIRFGGAGALQEALSKLGSVGQGWEGLLDSVTLGAAEAADKSGTSLMAQLEKAHNDRLLAEEDIRAAKGLARSGQVGYEIGEARQADTIVRQNALNDLLDVLRGGIGGFATREAQRNIDRSAALNRAGERVRNSGMTPPAPPQPPATPPALMRQLIANSKKPPRRPIGGWGYEF